MAWRFCGGGGECADIFFDQLGEPCAGESSPAGAGFCRTFSASGRAAAEEACDRFDAGDRSAGISAQACDDEDVADGGCFDESSNQPIGSRGA